MQGLVQGLLGLWSEFRCLGFREASVLGRLGFKSLDEFSVQGRVRDV